MKKANKFAIKSMSYLLTVMMVMSMIISLPFTISANEGTNIDYVFSGKDANKAGYAQGRITLSSDTDGTYYLYWADDTKALDGYYPIDEFKIENGQSASFEFKDHTAIPANATKLIAVTNKTDLTVSNAVSVYDIPADKQFSTGSGKLLYSFNSYSDVHIDVNGYYVNAERNWKQALKFATDKGTDFIVSSGDMVTNASGPDGEWAVYEKALADSDYVNPVWESDGNHDMRCGVSTGIKSFVRASGTDNTIANYDANKPYYYVTEQSTGDIFIFMALENDSNPSSCDEFSDEQITWVENLLNTYYGTGVNIYIIEHSPINGFGAGDRMSNPYYKAHLSENFISTVKFKSMLIKYPDLIWMSGHTHEDFTMGYNYSNENGTACNMIHNPAVAGSTWASETESSLNYNSGMGFNSQGYYVETYENQVVYYGANLTDELIYPEYCYIMNGSRNTNPDVTNPTVEVTTQSATEATGVTGSTLPDGIDTQRFYFANTLKWQFVDCYSWASGDTTTCAWPGYAATYYGTSEEGVDLYYCDIPAKHENIIWNNANNGYQTSDITLDGTNNFFTPASTTSSKKVPVTASVWDYNPVTDPTNPTETTTMPTTESTEPTTESTEPTTESTEPTTESTEPTTESTEPTTESTEPTTESTEPTTESTEPTTESTEPTTVSITETTEATTEPGTTVPVTYELGDVNMDGFINIQDATVVQRYISRFITLTDKQLELADVDDDNRVCIIDATKIQKYVTKFISEFTPSSNSSKSLESVGSNNESTASTLAETLNGIKQELEEKYTFASYDQYQSLKKYYYRYKDTTSVDNESEVIAEFARLSTELNTVALHIGYPQVYIIGDTYYFENTKDWATVNCYAWKGSSTNAAWPGVAIQKVGTNYGHDVYGVKFDYAGQFTSLIFNNGSDQTIDLALSTYEFNCFSLDGTSSNGKFNVNNFNFTSEVQPTVPPTTTNPVTDDEHYALCYYNSTYHGWSSIDTFLAPQSDGTYALDFVTTNSENISCNIFDKSSSTY
ncbi:MAG: starch-binding protein, partial [Ruminococcus sp.]